MSDYTSESCQTMPNKRCNQKWKSKEYHELIFFFSFSFFNVSKIHNYDCYYM